MLNTIRRYTIKQIAIINSSYWFIPSIICLAGACLSLTMVYIDKTVGISFLQNNGFAFLTKIDGGTEILTTIAASMMTVAGVTFSMTLLSVSHASSQIGPRILANFMKDRGNQVTLGVFISTFIYSILVLRFIKVDEGSESLSFTPHLSIYVAYLLAVFSIIVLIYFINHVPKAINMTLAVSSVGSNFLRSIMRMYPDKKLINNQSIKANHFEFDGVVMASSKGYLQFIDVDQLVKISKKFKIKIEVCVLTGDFVSSYTELAKYESNNDENSNICNMVKDCFVWGAQKTINQDTLFAADLLVEVTARALSSGVNDPFSAIECIDQIQVGLCELANRNSDDIEIKQKDNEYYVKLKALSFEKLANHIFNQLRVYVSKDPVASTHLLRSIHIIYNSTDTVDYKSVLNHQAEALVSEAQKHITDSIYLNKLKNILLSFN